MKILVVMPMKPHHKELLNQVAPGADIIYMDASLIDEEIVQAADIIVGNVPPKYIAGSMKLKLLQLNSAGTDGYTTPGVMPSGAMLCNATGAYGLAISEHMIAMLLCLMKKLDLYHDNMQAQKWLDCGEVTSIFGSRTLVVGLGDIGSEFAIRMHAMGSSVSAIRRTAGPCPSYIEKMYLPDDLFEALSDADIVATCLPGTPQTVKMFNDEAFSHMKDGAFFLNVGRGSAVDSDALKRALDSGKLAGAGLDVTDPEPLLKGHPLWGAPGLLITPHVSGGYHLPETHNRIVEIAARNISHYLNHEPFENVVDMETGYRKK